MEFRGVAPPGWDQRIASPMLSEGFAEASRALGYRPFFVDDHSDRALILVRQIPLPVLGRLTQRAKVYVNVGDPIFLRTLLERLEARGVSHVRIGDERHGVPASAAGQCRARPVPHHVFLVDTADRADEALIMAMSDPVPRNIRKAERAGVKVAEIRTEAELDVFLTLMAETVDRMRSRRVAAVYPDRFFRSVFRDMVPRGQALFLLARAGGEALAAHMYLVGRDRLTYYHGASTRNRDLTPKHGPTAIFWHAMRLVAKRGLVMLDMGAATPTSDRAHVHFSVTDFKRRWGGRHVEALSLDVTLAPAKVVFQERLLKPLWDRAHPLYLRLFPQP